MPLPKRSKKIPTSATTSFKNTYRTIHLACTPVSVDHTTSHFSHIQYLDLKFNLLKPTRHTSLNYDKGDKYISQNNSFILKKVYRINQLEDQNLQIKSRKLGSDKYLFDAKDINEANLIQSPFSGSFSLQESSEKKNLSSMNKNKSPFFNKSPFMFKFTTVESFRPSESVHEMKNEEEEESESESSYERKNILNQSIVISENQQQEFLEFEEENKSNILNKVSKGTPYSKNSEKEKRILDFLESENIIWIPFVEKRAKKIHKKKNEQIIENKNNKSAFKSDLLKRRGFQNLKINLSSSCDDLTAIIHEKSIHEVHE